MVKSSKQLSQNLDVIKANRFDPNALAANQAGTLAPGQMNSLKIRLASMLLSSILAIILGIAWIVWAISIALKGVFQENWLFLILAVLMIVFGVMWVVDGIKHLLRDVSFLKRDIFTGEVVVIEGPAYKNYDDRHYASLWHRLLNWIFYSSDNPHIKPFQGTHFYVLNEEYFIVSQKEYAALTDGLFYRFYYVPHSKRLVNIECVPTATDK